ncbi:zinc finger protein 700 isoform X2 [Pangasianodon hypophthalmus]|uniref:zinc finger protein 700 isoform X2 n=1 Tax=Pangasianodon hypophthalmus TaxID=310915 RepID=UPI002307170B|nr:zinc finger protein 700 isoform X2 [Pangasianodon hypophthalmus]
MTKLDELNVFLSERLSAAVNEILDTVSRMMQEYEEETARIRKENDYLKEMLKLTGWSFTEINPGKSPNCSGLIQICTGDPLMWAFQSLTGVSLGKQDGMSNLQHESETWEGWCQNPELKEESTSIKIEQPDPPYPAHPDSEDTDKFPISDLEMGSPISDVWNSLKNSKGKAKLKLKKKHYCLYCKKPSPRMAQHLLSAHAREPEVAKALSYDKKSKERKQLLDLLQSKGNLLHKDVGMSRTLVSSKWHATAGSNKDYVQCIYCLGLYSSKSIANHIKRCKHKYPYRAKASTASPMSSTSASQPGTSLSEELLPANQASSPNSKRSCSAIQENPNPESVSTRVSDTHHSAAQLHTDTESAGSPCEDLGLVGEQLLADLESQSDLTSDTSLVRNDHVHKNPTCSSPAYYQTETSKSEDKKTDAEQSRSSYVETESRVINSPSDEEESVAQNTQLSHICQHCSATFCSPYHLRRHEYTHTNERPFWCSECNMGFIQKYRYRNHRMIHHEERHCSVYKDQSRRRKSRSSSGEKPAESELHQQQLAESTAGTSEPFTDSEERV